MKTGEKRPEAADSHKDPVVIESSHGPIFAVTQASRRAVGTPRPRIQKARSVTASFVRAHPSNGFQDPGAETRTGRS